MDAYQLETTADRFLLEDGTGVLLLEQQAGVDEPMPQLGGGYYPEQG